MPPHNRDDYNRMKDVLNFFSSGQPRQGWHHWQDYVHRQNLQVGYENPLPAPTLKIKFLAVVLFIVWALRTVAGIALFLTIDGIKDDLGLNGRFREFYAIRRVLSHINVILNKTTLSLSVIGITLDLVIVLSVILFIFHRDAIDHSPRMDLSMTSLP